MVTAGWGGLQPTPSASWVGVEKYRLVGHDDVMSDYLEKSETEGQEGREAREGEGRV